MKINEVELTPNERHRRWNIAFRKEELKIIQDALKYSFAKQYKYRGHLIENLMGRSAILNMITEMNRLVKELDS